MLRVTRREGQKVRIGEDVVVEILEITGTEVRLGFEGPRETPVHREELWQAIKQENEAAASDAE
jgi:carbon storage regulator